MLTALSPGHRSTRDFLFSLPAFSKCFISSGLIFFINYYAILDLSRKDKNQSLLCTIYMEDFKDTDK